MLFKYAMCIVHDGTMERGGTGMPEQNNKLKLVRAVMLCVTLAIMAAIFLFSAQPGESSSALSQQITEKVESTAAHRLTPKWFSSQNDNANIRKWAHVYIYCALGVSTAVTVHLFGSAGKAGGAKQLVQEALISAVTCTAYAGTDEFHQLFIPGRAGMIQDVGVDALGFFALHCHHFSGHCLAAAQSGQNTTIKITTPPAGAGKAALRCFPTRPAGGVVCGLF